MRLQSGARNPIVIRDEKGANLGMQVVYPSNKRPLDICFLCEMA